VLSLNTVVWRKEKPDLKWRTFHDRCQKTNRDGEHLQLNLVYGTDTVQASKGDRRRASASVRLESTEPGQVSLVLAPVKD